MRVLFISEQFPFPLHDGGNLRTYHVLRGLTLEHDVTLVSHKPTAHRYCEPISDLCRLITIPRASKLLRLGSNVIQFGARMPLFLLKNRSSRLLTIADRLLSSEPFDVVHFNHLDTACFALERNWPHASVFDSHNCLSDLVARAENTASTRTHKAILRREARLLEAQEAAVCGRANTILVCSDKERASFQKLCPSGYYETVPNGVDTDFFCPAASDHEEPGMLVFSGAMGYWPNEQAAVYFCEQILPTLRRLSPEVRVYFVGKTPTSRVQSLHDGQSVFVTGQVDDVRPYLRRAQIVIVPLRHGAGTRLKILEAFAMGKPVVSTSLGADGIAAADGDQILLADDPADFAAKVSYLLQETALRMRLGREALALAKKVYDWTSIQQHLLGIYGRIRSNSTYSLSA